MNPHDENKLEHLVHAALRELPPRTAPDSLSARVLAEIERRAALPWWRRNYASWPVAARGAFFVLSALAAALIVAGLLAVTRTETGPLHNALGWLASAREVGRLCLDTGLSLFAAVPPLWLYGTLAFLAACYALLVGVGATVWQLFRTPRAASSL